MSVVQRCPSCGTTQATAGECEACHEAEVRYFCTNHTPGVWLDASTCPSCGARFGEAAPRESAGRVRTRAAAPSPAIPPVRTRSRAPSPARVDPPAASDEVWADRRRPSYDEELEPGGSRMALLQQILRAAVRARYSPPARYRERRGVGPSPSGCLKRLLLSAVLLLVAFGGLVFVFGRALLGM
jgi:hypothetical protein